MDRRRFLMTSLAGALAAPLAAEAQQPGKTYRIGILLVGPPEQAERFRQVYSTRLTELGWQEGRNLTIDLRHTSAADRTAELAASLVTQKPDVLIGVGPYAAQSLKDTTRTIPIVFAAVADPVGRGLVASLARPGGNITGVSHLTGAGFGGKERQLLMELLPGARRFAILINPVNPYWHTIPPLRESVDALHREQGIAFEVVEARTEDAIPAALEAAARSGAKGLIVTADSVFSGARKGIVELAMKRKLPAIYPDRSYVAAGGLFSYGTHYGVVLQRSADYVDKILRGARPAELPIEQPSRYELLINLKTAKALGLTIPTSLLARADQVIE
jgi:putative ABC transport system substrate-binding protein